MCFQCNTNLSRRPLFSNGLINTNRCVYIKDWGLAAVSVDSVIIKKNRVDFIQYPCEHKRWRANSKKSCHFDDHVFSFRLKDRSTFGSQHVKYGSQDRSQRARTRLIVVCSFTEIDYNYLLWKHDGKLNFPLTLITLSWQPWDTRSMLS